MPLRSRKSNKVPKKTWITNHLLNRIEIKHKMYKSMKINGNHTMLEEYNKYRNQLNNSLKNAEKVYYREQLNNNKDNLTKTWKTLNKIINKRKTNTDLLHL